MITYYKISVIKFTIITYNAYLFTLHTREVRVYFKVNKSNIIIFPWRQQRKYNQVRN